MWGPKNFCIIKDKQERIQKGIERQTFQAKYSKHRKKMFKTFFIALILLIGLLSFKELYDLGLKEKNLSLLITVLAYLAVAFLILNNYL